MSWWWTICCHTTCLNQERLSLLAVKDAFNLSSWKGLNCCEWEGVQCDQHSSHVVGIDSHQILSGVISPALFELKHLEYLDLSYNNLTGAIPAGLFKLQELKHLDLRRNAFEGNLSSNQLEGTFLLFPSKTLLAFPPSTCPPTVLGPYVDTFSNDSIGVGVGFQGSLPPTFNMIYYNRVQFYLDFHNNQLNGSLPMPSTPANHVYILDLSQNQFSGCIPQKIGELFPSLWFLSLSTNNLSGNIHHSIGNMQRLEVLDLSNNKLLGGKIPSSIANCTALTRLNLGNTGLKGQVPFTMGNLSELRTLHLGNNELFGNFPLALQNCSKLKILDMGNNNFSGKIPKWITMLSHLRILVLRRNKLEGSILSQLCLLKSLQILDLSHNKFSRTIPLTLGNLFAIRESHIDRDMLLDTNTPLFYYKEEIQVINKEQERAYFSSVLLLMTCIDLYANRLAGTIPEEIGELKGLHALNMSWNYIRGHIPASFGNMEQLESLDISHNQLDGKIPPEMVSLHSLAFFIVSNNQLSGSIPSEGQFSTFNATFFANNSGLCGFPLDKCGLTNKSNVPPYSPRNSNDEDEEPEITWYWCASVVASFAVGFWGVYWLLFMKRAWRAKLFEGMDAIAISLVDGIFGRR
eukprot:Gb_05566 [translate_table: standard]